MEDKYKHKIITIPNVLSFFRSLLSLWAGCEKDHSGHYEPDGDP